MTCTHLIDTECHMVCSMNVKTTLSDKKELTGKGCRTHVEINKDSENFMHCGNISF